jgi:2-dehydro-3-deoxyphosphogluconate aldolase/(4S)-4-hydroxy-2-oxoglutarate aldolase
MDRGSALALYMPLHPTLDALIGEPPPSSDRAKRGGTRIPLRKEELAEGLREVRLLAAVQGLNEQQLLRAVAALAEGGIRAVELSYATVRNARQLVHTLKGEGLLVGVGAITRSPQARESGMLGADFIAASVTAPDVVSACKEMEVPCILGALTATEIWRAHEMGADFVKVPAEALGGSHYIRSLREMVPTRHLIGAELPLDGYLSYLEVGVEVLEFKSSLALPELAESEDWAEISRRASNIVDAYDNWRASRNSGQPKQR